MDALRAQSIQAGIGSTLARQPSSDSVSSLSSACSLDKHDKKKKKGWLRSSFTKAFSRNAKVSKVQCQSDNTEERTHSPLPVPPTDPGLEVVELQKQLREKDLVLTDIRLEALSSAHQLESLKDTVMKMRVSYLMILICIFFSLWIFLQYHWLYSRTFRYQTWRCCSLRSLDFNSNLF